MDNEELEFWGGVANLIIDRCGCDCEAELNVELEMCTGGEHVRHVVRLEHMSDCALTKLAQPYARLMNAKNN